jgi:hypothetical protein
VEHRTCHLRLPTRTSALPLFQTTCPRSCSFSTTPRLHLPCHFSPPDSDSLCLPLPVPTLVDISLASPSLTMTAVPALYKKFLPSPLPLEFSLPTPPMPSLLLSSPVSSLPRSVPPPPPPPTFPSHKPSPPAPVSSCPVSPSPPTSPSQTTSNNDGTTDNGDTERRQRQARERQARVVDDFAFVILLDRLFSFLYRTRMTT